MLSNSAKEILLDLVNEGIVTFDVDIDNVNKDVAGAIKGDITDLKDSIFEAFTEGYITTYDNKLSINDLKEPTLKLLILNIDKMFDDGIFEDHKDYGKILKWYSNCKDEIRLYAKKGAFLSHMGAAGRQDIVHSLMRCNEEIIRVFRLENATSAIKVDLFANWFEQMNYYLSLLSEEFEYGKETFALKHYIVSAKAIDPNIFKSVKRNEACLCGSGNKAKYCCFAQ